MGKIKWPPWAAPILRGDNRGPCGWSPHSLLEVTLACVSCWGGGESLERSSRSRGNLGAAGITSC